MSEQDATIAEERLEGSPAATQEPEGEFDLEGISLEEPGTAAASETAGRPAPAAEAASPGHAAAPAADPGPSKGRIEAGLRLSWPQAALLGLLALAPTLTIALLGLPGRADQSPVAPAPIEAPELPRGGPEKPGAWAEARELAARGRLRQAIQGLEGFLGSEEGMLHAGEKVEAWLELSDWHHRVGDPEAAERYARKVIDLRLALTPIAKFFEWGEELQRDGLELLQAGRPVEAAESFAQARRHLARFLLQERSMSGASRARIALAHERIADTLRLQADAGERFSAAEEAGRGGRP